MKCKKVPPTCSSNFSAISLVALHSSSNTLALASASSVVVAKVRIFFFIESI